MAHEESDDFYIPPTLGELSRQIARERGELRDYDLDGKYVPPSHEGGLPLVNKAADLAREQAIVDRVTNYSVSPRPPALLYEVIATYDSRPIQGYDFQDSECLFLNWAGAPPLLGTVALEYEVPQNTVAVLRSFRYQVIDAPVNAVVEGDCWLQSDILVDDSPVREYHQMLHPVYMQLFFPTFIIVDELRTIKLQLSTFDPANTEYAGALNGTTSPAIAEIYGQLLVKTGIPKEFEISNAIGGGQL